jgi:hypothetical protein
MDDNSRTKGSIVSYLAIVWVVLLLPSCSPKCRALSNKILDADIVGTWHLAPESSRRLKWEGDISDTEAQDCFFVLKGSRECQFHSYSIATRKFTDIAGRWELDHGVPSKSEQSTPNVVRISLPMNGRQEMESLFVGATHRKLVLCANFDNGFGDSIVVTYVKK